MSLSWDALDGPIGKGDSEAVTAVLLSASEAGRLAFAPAVAARIRVEQARGTLSARRPADMLALLVIGCSPDAEQAAALLSHGDMRDWTWIPTSRFLEIARSRRLTWTADLGARLAATVGPEGLGAGEWRLVSSLLADGDVPPPVTEGIVRSWLTGALRDTGDLAAVPHLDLMLPAVFEIDGMAADLADAGPEFLDAVAGLAAGGRLERAALLAMTVDRLVRGGRPAWLRPFVTLHDRLAPSPAEIAAHAAGHVRLIGAAPPVVAGLAQRALRSADRAGLLPRETLLEAAAAVLTRPEKTLVRAQLSWLGRVARRDPARAGKVAAAVGAAFGHPALDVQEQALTLISGHLPALDTAARAGLAAASPALADVLQPRAAAMFATPAVPPPEDEAPARVSPVAPSPASPASPISLASPVAEMPPAVASAGELGEEVVALLHAETAVRWERILDGLARLPAEGDTSALRAVLRQVLHRHRQHFGDRRLVRLSFLGEAIRAVAGHQPQPGIQRHLSSMMEACAGGRPDLTTPDEVLTSRIAELALRLPGGPLPGLLATPTHVTGSIAADVLVSRIARAEASDPRWAPWPFDVEQALLRVSPTDDPAILARASALASAAGRRLARWLRDGGPPSPVSSRHEQTTTDEGRDIGRRVVANLRPGDGAGSRTPLATAVFTLEQPSRPYDDPWRIPFDGEILAMVTPHHREAAAAWLLPVLAGLGGPGGGDSALLPILAEGSGPAGPAMALAVAYGLGARRTADRAAGVDAFLLLAAGSEPFAAALGAELGDLCGDGTVRLSRVVTALGDAHTAGASAAVWEVLTAMLPPLLVTAPRGLADLLELAAGVVGAIGTAGGVPGRIPGLAAVATRGGGSRFVREARRLHIALAEAAGRAGGRTDAAPARPATGSPFHGGEDVVPGP
ncbi:DUF6493 family protein [Actinoplanes utahensis]|uniref:Secreted protein n=1 Tax=Actinoplanes utahensis TaxID=1869 RepID=A0A0A6X3K9_ACTUT|nr:DUF6493 family protein [Actinoplanes utahensis]KHD74692.1 hypothetical protein MB27_27230 [Actinoplanes utahensis]GIF34431.1 hypothetical protein Aut01nite_74170 [Actinoplanes utahensis]